MAITASTRLGLTRWSASSDAFSRTQLDADHALLDANMAMYKESTYAAMGAASPGGRFCYTTDTHLLYYSDGNTWHEVTSGFATVASVASAVIHPFLLAGM